MKKLFGFFVFMLLFVLLIVVIFFKGKVNTFLDEKIFKKYDDVEIKNNEYSKTSSYQYVSIHNSFLVLKKQDILDIIYTIINSSNTHVTFYCSMDYENCLDDVSNIVNDKDTLSYINNYVHPFNSFSFISFSYSDSGKIDVNVIKKYKSDEILEIEKLTDEIIKKEIKTKMSDKEKITAIHDYIVNNTKYDSSKKEIYDNALSLLKYHKGICSGYADLMSVFLTKLGFDNYLISTTNHIWNVVYVDNNWLHIDTTFDDPVVSDGSDILLDDYLLITTDELEKLNDNSHNYNRKVFAP